MSKCSLLVNTKFQSLAEKNRDVLDTMISDLKGLNERARTIDGFRKSVDKYIRDTGESNMVNSYYKTIQLGKSLTNQKRIKASPTRVEGMKSLLRASNYQTPDSGLTLESVQSTRNIKYQTILDQSLTDGEFKILASGEMDKEIILYISSGGKKGDPQVKKIAETFQKYNSYLHNDKLNVGIMENFIKDYAFNQRDLYNIDKMKEMGKDAWVRSTFKNVDHERTFPNLTATEDQLQYLANAYDGFINRSDDAQAVDFTNLPKERVKGQIPKKYAKARQIYYTSEGLSEMFSTFSDKSLIESITSEGAKTARDIAIFETLGPGGQNAFATLVQKNIRELQAEIRGLKPSDAKYISVQKEIKSIKDAGSSFNQYFAELTNSSNIGNKNTTSEVMSNMRALTGMGSLGATTISAITDVAFAMTALQTYTGQGYFKTVVESIGSMFKNIKPEQQRALAAKFAISLETNMGNYLRIQGSTNPVSRFINKLNNLHNKINPMLQQARATRAGAASLLSLHLGEWSSKGFNDLELDPKNNLLKAGIKEADWKGIQAMRKNIEGDQFAVDTISTHEISPELCEELIANHRKTDPLFQPKTPQQYRAYLEKRLDSYYNEFANNAAPNPGARERKNLLMGTQKGTNLGELMATLTMFKSFTVKQASIMQRVYNNNPNRSAKINQMSGMFLGLTTMAYMAESLRAIANNETPPDPTDPKTLAKVITRSGAGSVFGDALLSGDDKFMVNFLAGPVVSKTQDAFNIAKNVVTGQAGSKDADKATSLLPFNNLWYLKSALHYTFLDDFKEEMKPGHKAKMEQRRRDNEGLLWKQEKIVD